jgi:UDP-N-acetylglucosamine 2-epimerase (non-hydrolysing)
MSQVGTGAVAGASGVVADASGAVVHVVGARPNFIKAAPVLRALGALGVRQRLVHTGQHYDPLLSDVFFRDLSLPSPDVSLGVGSGSQGHQTGALLAALEDEFVANRPAMVVAYGDVNSTLAAALVCAKLLIPVAHVEAGLRSFDITMPEEVNRRVTDVLSDLLFVTSPEGLDNLANEGVPADRVHLVGNPMIDTLLAHLDSFDPGPVRARLGVPERYAVATLHRPANVDTPAAAARLVAALGVLAERLPVVLPLHPRGRATLGAAGLADVRGIAVVDPLGYLEFLSLVRGAALVVTDSGGIQEETTVLGIPCLTLRPNTERPVTITHGTNRLVEPEALGPMVDAALRGELGGPADGPPLWDGHAGERIAAIIVGHLA